MTTIDEADVQRMEMMRVLRPKQGKRIGPKEQGEGGDGVTVVWLR